MTSGYKLKGNRRNAIIARILVVIILVSVASAFSGFANIGRSKVEDISGFDGKPSILVYDKKTEKHYTALPVFTNNQIGAFKEVDNGIHSYDVDVSELGNYANYNDCVSTSGTIFRKTAILMHDSLFGSFGAGEGGGTMKYNTSADFFIQGDDLLALSLAPNILVQEISEKTSGLIESEDGTFADIKDALKGTVTAILIAIWMMGFISQIVNEKFSMETLLKTFMQLICGVLVVNNADNLVNAFMGTGNLIVREVGNVSETVQMFTGLSDEITTQLSKVKVIDISFCFFALDFAIGPFALDGGALLSIAMLALPFFAQVLCAYKIVSIMVMRMLELITRLTFAAVPLAFSVQNGFSQESIRYFRSVLACAAQPALIILGCMMLGNISTLIASIVGENATTGIPAILGLTLSYFILSAFIGETKHLSQEIIAR